MGTDPKDSCISLHFTGDLVSALSLQHGGGGVGGDTMKIEACVLYDCAIL